MSAKTIESARIAGAQKCIESLLAIESVAKDDYTDTAEETLRKKDAALKIVMDAAGPLSPMGAGFLGLLVELALDSLQNGYTLSEQLEGINSGWRTESTMTAQELGTARADFVAHCPAIILCKVVSMADWMTAQ